MKNLLLTLPILTAMLFNTAITENDVNNHSSKKSKGSPMVVFKKTSPMPLLMSVIVKHGEELNLTEKQSAVFNQWRVDNMGPSLKLGNEILTEEAAIQQAAIDGKPNTEIKKMLSSMLEKRNTMASNMLNCRDMIMSTLDEGQWGKFVTLYGKMNKTM